MLQAKLQIEKEAYRFIIHYFTNHFILMKVLVTGAAGFVGTALTKHLVASGYNLKPAIFEKS